MSFDGIVTKAVVDELREKLIGGRINSIYQPEIDELNLNIHNKGENYKLLISSSSHSPRIHLSTVNKKNPQVPPLFCMLLRKHLAGGFILDIRQYEMDRIVFIDISSVDELGDQTEITLAVEIMGRHSNIILFDKSKNKILDAVNRVSEDISRVRQVIPGLPYTFPPIQDKENPLTSNREEFVNLLKNERQNLEIYKFLYFNYLGMSPLISREICNMANLDTKRSLASLEEMDINNIYTSFDSVMEKIRNEDYSPMYVTDKNGKILAFYCLDLKQFGEKGIHREDSISKILDISFDKKDNYNRIQQKSQNMRRTIQTSLERSQNKLKKQKEEYKESKDREKYKIYADILSANFHNIPRGQDKVVLQNFYDENLADIEIPLDIKLTPPQNADRYYKRYSRLKNAEKLLSRRIPVTKHEILYLENVLNYIDNTDSVEDLEEIRDELISESYIRDTSKKKKKKTNISAPHHYISSDGFDIYVGKNNRQNDELTLRTANKDDLWLHIQNMPGSHVIIRRNNQDIPATSLEEAAILAAYYSKARNSTNVAVDYTEKKNVKKAKGAKPGMVFYENFNTIIVSPSQEVINKLEKK